MNIIDRPFGVALVVMLMTTACLNAPARAQQGASPKAAGAPAVPRPIVVISDLHFGVGKSGEEWDRLEDFRWNTALRGFLDKVSTRFGNAVDLVVAGDLLELWQHPKICCQGCGADLGCRVTDIEKIA